MSRECVMLDRYSRGVLTLLTILAGVIAVELWSLSPNALAPAAAQIPDTAQQRKQIVDEARKTNATLMEILTHLREKSIKVQLAAPEKEGGAGRARR